MPVTRQHGAPIVPPAAGSDAFLNPRVDDPLRFLELDLLDTHYVIAREGLSQVERERANFTIDTLDLNREVLCRARASAFRSYRALLREFGDLRDGLSEQGQLNLIDGLKSLPHPTVWEEMKRQRLFVEDLNPLFERVPEALNW